MAYEITEDQKELVKKYIEAQPIKVVEEFDYKKEKVKYCDELKGRTITKLNPEEIVRAYLLTKLVNEYGYKLSEIEIEHEYKAGRPKTITSRIDIIVRNKTANSSGEKDAFLFIEIKKPEDYYKLMDTTIEEQLFKLAVQEEAEKRQVSYLVHYTISFTSSTVEDECMLIDYQKFHTYKDWKIDRNYVTDIPSNYGRAINKPYIRGTKKDLETSFTVELLNTLQTELHNVLWGGGGTDANDIFSSLTNLILAKIQDENDTQSGKAYQFQCLSYVKDGEEEFEPLETLFERVNKLYRKALKDKLNITDEEEISKSYVVDTKKFSLAKVKFTVQKLERFSFVDGKNSVSGKDILGDFFENIIREEFKQNKGQFFTHINIVRFMLWAIQADRLAIKRINEDKEIPYMIDPSAGSGTFLIEYMKFITQNIKYRFRSQIADGRAVQDRLEDWFYPDNRENKWAKEYIYASELNFNLGTAIKVNMILHGDGSTNVFVGAQKGDGLLPFSEYTKPAAPNALNKEFGDILYGKKVNGQFDLILTNPPFSVDLDNETKKVITQSFLFGDKKNSENLFLERYYQLLREGGRLAAVLPDSVFDTTENKYIRLFLYKYFIIKAVVSLPQLSFAPFTNTKTSILFAKKKAAEEIKEWNVAWEKYSAEYQHLRTRVENIVSVHDGKKKKEKLPSIRDLTAKEERELLEQMLKSYLEEEDSSLNNSELIIKYHDELADLCAFDKDTAEEFGYVNTWWVFEAVARELSYDVFMAEADNVGYKRTKRSIKPQPNDLYRVDPSGTILVDDGIKETILDYIREVEW